MSDQNPRGELFGISSIRAFLSSKNQRKLSPYAQMAVVLRLLTVKYRLLDVWRDVATSRGGPSTHQIQYVPTGTCPIEAHAETRVVIRSNGHVVL